MRLRAEEGLKSSLDLRRLGLVVESNQVVLGSSPTSPSQGPVIDLMVEGAFIDHNKMNVDEAVVQMLLRIKKLLFLMNRLERERVQLGLKRFCC